MINRIICLCILSVFYSMVNAQDESTGCITGDCVNGRGTYEYDDGAKYVGEFYEGEADGFGVLYYANGSSYVGQFKDHQLTGQGAWYYSDGTIEPGYYDHDGNWVKAADAEKGCLVGNCENGYGIKYWDNGTKYDGDFKDGNCHGYGTCYFDDGSMYIGEWADHKFNGSGTRYYTDGTIESGTFKDGNFESETVSGEGTEEGGCIKGDCENGEGTYVYSDGSKYIGEFVDGKCNGFGVCYFASGNTYVGEFVDHSVAGQGAWYYPDGSVIPGFYDINGNWVNAKDTETGCLTGDCSEGYGVKYWDEGTKYDGYFKNGNCDGYGTCYFNDGSMYVGNWANHKFNGEGTRYHKDGTIERGYFRDSNFLGKEGGLAGCISGDCDNGYGIYRWSNNETYSGEFRDGRLSGYGTYFFASGAKYIGNWLDAKFEGEGTYTDQNGVVQTGTWKNNELVTSSAKEDSKAEITWKDPSSLQTGTTYNTYSLQACIQSESEVTKVQVLVNNKVLSTDTQFKEDPLSGCTILFTKDINLGQGSNKVNIVVENTGGIATSSERMINLATASQQKRLALVIGNSEYQFANVLKNPVNDARSIARVLEMLGFTVVKVENATGRQMKMSIDQFGQDLERYDVGLFYYAGHGIQVKGLNYLVPVDAQIQSEAQVEYDCIQADRVMSFMEYAETDVNIIILDACRNNPFKRSWSRSSGTEGLAFMNAPSGTLIAYATAPGHTASDGEGENGLYTEALLQEINNDDLSIIQVFQRVRSKVADKSAKSQIPWESTSLTGDFYFSKIE